MTDGFSPEMLEALSDFGVSGELLTDCDVRSLDDSGYLVIPNVLSADQLLAIGKRLDELADKEGEDAGKEVHQEAGATRLSNLIDKDPVFEICYSHPKVLAAVAHVLKHDFKLSSLNSRAALPGEGLQGLHIDTGETMGPGQFAGCNSIWFIDDFTEANGATRAVPGSHLTGKKPREVMEDPKAPHPDEVQFIAPAGTVVVFNAHTWHGGVQNQSEAPRRALHSFFCRRQFNQQLNQREYLSPQTVSRLTDAGRWILDVD